MRLLELFVAQVTARTAANLVGVNYHTAHLFYHKLRELIMQCTEDETPFFGEIEVDESYFGGVQKGKRGRGSPNKIAVFGILKRGGKVYAKAIPNIQKATLIPIMKARIVPDSVVYTDGLSTYRALDVKRLYHHRIINHEEELVSKKDRRNHINGIENFWSQAKRVLRRYNGIPKEHFHLFLKECEFRFNYGDTKQQLETLKKWANLT